MTIRVKFALFMALPLVVVYVVLNLMQFLELARTTMREQHEQARTLVQLQADEVSAFARLARLRAEGILSTTGAFDAIDPTRVQILLAAAASPKWIAGIGLVDNRLTPPLKTVVDSSTSGTNPVDPEANAALLNAMDTALKSRSGGWSPGPKAPSSTMPIFVMINSVKGIAVGIAVDASALTELIHTTDDRAEPWIVTDKHGTVLFGHPIDKIGQNIRAAFPEVTADGWDTITIAMKQGETGEVEIPDPRYWLGWTPVNGSPWQLSLPIDMRSIMEPVWSAVRRDTMLAITGLLINLAVIALLAGLFTRPIRRLANAFNQVRSGDLNTRVDVRSRDELGRLAEGFNQMTSQLGALVESRSKAKVHRAAVERELDIAREMQASLLPNAASLPDTKTGRVLAVTRSAKQVGGDFYDAWVQDGDVWFTVADVSGKGVGAGLFMAVASTILHGLRHHVDDPAAALDLLNTRLLEDGIDRPVFLTMFLGRLNVDGTLQYASAGHLPPIHITADGKQPKAVADATGPPLGMVRDMHWTNGTLHLGHGDHLLVYSDGASDAKRQDGSMVEIEGLADMAAAAAANGPDRGVLDTLVQQLTDIQTDGQFDDITLLSVTRPLPDES
jgi:sigma-B regulation protein RsbU (phosphoserine phosphatase)